VFVVSVYGIVVVWAPALKQTAATIPVVVMVGKPFTVTLTACVLAHPFPLVMVIVPV
jgi:hypothetical protein